MPSAECPPPLLPPGAIVRIAPETCGIVFTTFFPGISAAAFDAEKYKAVVVAAAQATCPANDPKLHVSSAECSSDSGGIVVTTRVDFLPIQADWQAATWFYRGLTDALGAVISRPAWLSAAYAAGAAIVNVTRTAPLE